MSPLSGSAPTTLLNTTVVGQPWQQSFQLGLGVDAITGQLRAQAVKPFKVDNPPSQSAEFIYSLVQSESDIQSLISGSVKAAYNLEGVTVSASTSFLDELAVSELAVTLVAQVSIKDVDYSLAPKYELAVDPGADFRDKYGDYFVAGYRGGSSMYVVYQCRFSSAEQRSKFTAALSADMPDVFSVDGSASFERTTKQFSANMSIHIKAQGVNGVTPPPPSSGWTPENIVSVLLPWFNNSIAKAELDTYLEHYRLIDPRLSGDVPIDPLVFSRLSFLYNRFWLVRALVKTCPDFGRGLVEERYQRLESEVEAYQASLPSDPAMIEQLTTDTQGLLQTLQEINNRQLFYTQVIAAAKTEPAKDQNFDADKGTVRWSYGFSSSSRAGVVISSDSQSVSQDWHVGWREHTFGYNDSTKVLVGWDVTCNRNEDGGDWHKASDRIIGGSKGDIFVKSDYDRGYDWTVVWYHVDASLYPTGPWSESRIHAPAFQSAVNANANSAVAHWTPERMAAARPVDRSSAIVDQMAGGRRPAGRGRPGGGRSRGTQPSKDQADVQLGPNTSRVADPRAYPYRTVGKLFYNMGGQPFTASAAVVNRVGIITAAHCLVLDGQQATDIVFVPAFHNGNAPFGAWPVAAGFWPNNWIHSPVPAWDVGFCTVQQDQSGRGVGDVVGWVGLEWGEIASCWNDVGYPAQPIPGFPFDGQTPWESIGSRVEVAYPSAVGKLDNLTAGGSGGPWFMAGNTARVNGLFSQYNTLWQTTFSPQFSEWVGVFYAYVFGRPDSGPK